MGEPREDGPASVAGHRSPPVAGGRASAATERASLEARVRERVLELLADDLRLAAVRDGRGR